MRLIISDLHLDPSRPRTTQAFFEFLQAKATLSEELYILGDFFELWVGDDDDNDFIRSIKKALKQLVKAGNKVFFMHGNRDFMIGPQFCADCGMSLIEDPLLLTLGGQECLLMHGDSLCIEDKSYQEFRAQVRQPEWQKMVLDKSLEERRILGQQIREQSKTMSSRKPADITDVTQSEVERVMREHKVTVLIHGHTHRPKTHVFDLDGSEVTRLVLGDWDENAWCIEISENTISLQNWKI